MLSIHSGVAALTETPELKLEPGEAKALADGLRNVARHYEFLAGASQKVVDWGNLITICGMIYGTKLYTVRHRQSGAAETAPATSATAPAANVAVDTGFGVEIPREGEWLQ